VREVELRERGVVLERAHELQPARAVEAVTREAEAAQVRVRVRDRVRVRVRAS